MGKDPEEWGARRKALEASIKGFDRTAAMGIEGVDWVVTNGVRMTVKAFKQARAAAEKELNDLQQRNNQRARVIMRHERWKKRDGKVYTVDNVDSRDGTANVHTNGDPVKTVDLSWFEDAKPTKE